ncbi:MAG TPA: sigma-70 family RNA polymerase sigma factor [Anaerolineae bacterium]|nr:sigma-70 family RNA polymerase sigma factor [Anaerolineae bacterium]
MSNHASTSSGADALDPAADSLHRLLAEEEARELLSRARLYDERALTRIYNLFADRVFRFIYYRVQDRPHAEDLTNEVFIRMLESITNFHASGDDAALLLTGWIFTIARNIVIDYYRRQKTQNADPLSDTAEEIPDDTFDSDFHLTRADLQLALAKLTEEQQTVLLLRFEEGFTSAQIAKMMGKTDMAIKALQRRALASMARLLDEEQLSPETLRKQWSRKT